MLQSTNSIQKMESNSISFYENPGISEFQDVKQFICSSASLCCYVRHVSMVSKRIGNRKGMMLNYKGVYSHFFPMISNTPPAAPAVIWGCRLE